MRVVVVCFATAVLLFNKPLGRLTAEWQKMMGSGVVSETTNRVFFVAAGVIALVLAFWAN